MKLIYLPFLLLISTLSYSQVSNLTESERIQLNKANYKNEVITKYLIQLPTSKTNQVLDKTALINILNDKEGVLFYKETEKTSYNIYCTDVISDETLQEIFLMSGIKPEVITSSKQY